MDPAFHCPYALWKRMDVNDEFRYRDGQSIDEVMRPGGVRLDSGAARHVPRAPRAFCNSCVWAVQSRVGGRDG